MLVDAFCDLVLGGRCVGCDEPGRSLCPDCRAVVGRGVPYAHRPTPCPPGFPTTLVTGRYEGQWPQLLAAYKERGVWGLAPFLAERLWPAVRMLLTRTEDPPVLVPLPSRRAAVRERGLDTTATLARQVARHGRREGQPVPVGTGLRITRRVADSTGLSRQDRRRNLRGALELRPGVAERWRRAGRVAVLCDDLVTTGATLVEATRAITAAGVPVLGAVTLVATPRHHVPRPG